MSEVVLPPEPVTVKSAPLLLTLDTFTTISPVAAPVGTLAVMLVLVQPEVLALTPANWTLPDEPKLLPVMVTEVPTGPCVGVTPVIAGPEEVEVTVKVCPSPVGTPTTVTTTSRVVTEDARLFI